MNLNWNNIFINQMRLSLLCEKFGAIPIVLVDLIAIWQAVRQKIMADLKFSMDCIVSIFTEGTVLL